MNPLSSVLATLVLRETAVGVWVLDMNVLGKPSPILEGILAADAEQAADTVARLLGRTLRDAAKQGALP